MSAALGWQKFYPVEGDSAVAELLVDDRIWADVALANIRLDQRGEDRVTAATAVLRVYEPLESVDLDAILRCIQEARTWLFDNERAREPGVGPAASALKRHF